MLPRGSFYVYETNILHSLPLLFSLAWRLVLSAGWAIIRAGVQQWSLRLASGAFGLPWGPRR
jgi:hypothetical protein